MSRLYLFDTCFVSNAVKPGAEKLYPLLVDRFDQVMRAQGCYVAAATVFELRRGLEVARRRGNSVRSQAAVARLLDDARIFDLGDTEGPGWGFATDVWATAQSSRPPVSPPTPEDLMIAATAYAHALTLLTTDKVLVDKLTSLGFGAVVEFVPLA